MFCSSYKSLLRDQQSINLIQSSVLEALNRSMAVIHFDPNGSVIECNDNFSKLLGYRCNQLKGKHHSLFVDPSLANSQDYREFWRHLLSGQYHSGRYPRITAQGAKVWLQASYNPILDKNGQVTRIIKIASDITQQVATEHENQAQIQAIHRSMAVIEFTPDGTILSANDNFLNTVGYTLDEVKGKHHSLFVEPAYAQSVEYHQFWQQLAAGKILQDSFCRVHKNGKLIWLEASYNPIFNEDGQVYKVVKYAADTTVKERDNIVISEMMLKSKDMLKTFAEGNLTARIQYDNPLVALSSYRDTIKECMTSINAFGDNVRHIIHQATDVAQQVTENTLRVAENTSGLNQRTQETAASLEETAAFVEQMTASVKTNAQASSEVVELAASVLNASQVGLDVSQQAVESMKGVETSSNEIAAIIQLIDSIAFQTNLLALNAAVEAARAGEQGRGFAVVAGEVRSLAQKSAEASKQIKTIIESSQERVKDSFKRVSQTGEALHEISRFAQEVSRLTQGVAHASKEQSAGIHELNSAVGRIDSMTQHNAKQVEETAEIVNELNNEAQRLLELMSYFNTDDDTQPNCQMQ